MQNQDYKKTVKLTWLADCSSVPFTPTYCVYFEHIISKPLLGKDEDFKQFIGHETRVSLHYFYKSCSKKRRFLQKEVQMLGDPELRKLQKGDIIQLQRRGFYKVDIAYAPPTLHTCREQPIVLFYIPDGHTKENPATNVTKQTTTKAQKQVSIPVINLVKVERFIP